MRGLPLVIIALIYLAVAAAAVGVEALFGFDLPVVLLVMLVALAYSVGYLFFAGVRAKEHFAMARHVLFACTFSIIALVGTGAYVSYLRIQCTKIIAINHFVGPHRSPCNRSEYFVLDRLSYSAYTRQWYVSLYGRTLGFYSEDEKTWQFTHDQFIKRAIAAIRR
jgi:hypothetical protein